MAATDARVHATRREASSALEGALAPLIADYDKQVDAVTASQVSISSRLGAVLEELEKVQKDAPPQGENLMGSYAKKVVELRQRMETVAYTMRRVHVRLESLQAAVAKHEQLAAQQRRAAEAAKAASAASS